MLVGTTYHLLDIAYRFDYYRSKQARPHGKIVVPRAGQSRTVGYMLVGSQI